MGKSSLGTFTSTVSGAWSPIGTELIRTCRRALADLTEADEAEAWLAELQAEKPATRELFRDTEHGFMLLAHTEPAGLYRPPHDHGRAWVVYAVQSGALEVRTYGKVTGPDGRPMLVLREETLLRRGESRAYLPGDIHDTRCLSQGALLFRFTERDLRYEDQTEQQVTRYLGQGAPWAAAGA